MGSFPKYMTEKTIVTMESYDKKITYEIRADLEMIELYDALRSLVAAFYFSGELWDEFIIDRAKELEQIRKEARSHIEYLHENLQRENVELKMKIAALECDNQKLSSTLATFSSYR